MERKNIRLWNFKKTHKILKLNPQLKFMYQKFFFLCFCRDKRRCCFRKGLQYRELWKPVEKSYLKRNFTGKKSSPGKKVHREKSLLEQKFAGR